MAEGSKVWKLCPGCEGTGTDPKFVGNGEGVGGLIDDTCPTCNGTKHIFWGWMSKDDFTLPADLPDP